VLDASDLRVSLTFWRPQRSAIPSAGEPAGYRDIGHLHYLIQLPNPPGRGAGASGPTSPAQCSQSALSSADPSLAPPGGGSPADLGAPVDQADDQPANPANTLTMTLDLGACIIAKGGTTAPSGPRTGSSCTSRP